MKRSLCILAATLLVLMSLLPVIVYAESYHPTGTDMTIDIDSSCWYVFTRDNIHNNPELDEFGLSYEEIYDILYTNNAYIDAILLYEDSSHIEFFVRKTTQPSNLVNLSNYTNEDVLVFAETLAQRMNAQKYSVYQNQYKFSEMEYFDNNAGLYIYEFCTVVNKENYSFTFQSPSEFTEEKQETAKAIIDSIQFKIDPTLKERNNSLWSNVLTKAIGGAITGGIAGGVVAIVNKKRQKVNASNEAPVDQNVTN